MERTTIYDLQTRAQALRKKTQEGSITPEEVGGLLADTLAMLANIEQTADGLGIRKVYPTKEAMEADSAPMGTNGKPLRYGQLVSVCDDAHADNPENGNIYAYQKPGWMLIGNIRDNQPLPIVQEMGDDMNKVMSQAVVTRLLTQKMPFFKPSASENQKGMFIDADGSIRPAPSGFGVASYDIYAYDGIAFVESSAKTFAYLYAIYRDGEVIEVGEQLSGNYYSAVVDCSKGDMLYVQNSNNIIIEPVWKGIYEDLDDYMKNVLGKKHIIDLRDILAGGTNNAKFFYNKTLAREDISGIKVADKYACCKIDVSSCRGKTITLNTYGVTSRAYDSFTDVDGRILSQFQHPLPTDVLVPHNAHDLYLSTSFGRGNAAETFNYKEGDYPSVTIYEDGVYNLAKEFGDTKRTLDKIKTSNETYDLITPDLYSYVGDCLQLFKYPMSLRANYNALNMGLSLNTSDYNVRKLGKNLERYFQFTPSSDGVYSVLANLVRPDMVVLTQKSFNVTVKVPKNPTTVKNILLIGDSETEGVLNNSGVRGSESGTFPYANELKRLLQTTDGSPKGVGLTNVRLIGTRNTVNGRHEGYGGRTTISFLNNGSPFYIGGKIDFDAYLQQDKVYDDVYHKGVDIIYILLGANDKTSYTVQDGVLTISKALYKVSMKRLLAKIKEQIKEGKGVMANSNVKVVLLNYGFPYVNGFGYHPYGSGEFDTGNVVAKSFYECYKINNEIVAENDYKEWVFSTMCATQVDSENGFVYMDKPLNNYIPDTEKVSLEQVHFNRSAYQQFAQAVLRDIIYRVS